MKKRLAKSGILGVIVVLLVVVLTIGIVIQKSKKAINEIPAEELAMLLSYPQLTEDEQYVDEGT